MVRTKTLVILAAGVGSRYGGNKQLEYVTPNGETLMEFSIYDALAAGIGKIVFVTRRAILDLLRSEFEPKIEGRAELAFVCQDEFRLPADAVSRTKPWGTGHAILSVSEVVDDNFWVINADDFYGRSSFLAMASAPGDGSAMVAFDLGSTLSENGPVSRGQCVVGNDGLLASVIERKGIMRDNGVIVAADDATSPGRLSADTPVSMNFWGFEPGFFGLLEKGFEDFVKNSAEDSSAEYYITRAVNDAIENDDLRINVIRSTEQWVGLTYRNDRLRAAEYISGLRERGIYPPRLW